MTIDTTCYRANFCLCCTSSKKGEISYQATMWFDAIVPQYVRHEVVFGCIAFRTCKALPSLAAVRLSNALAVLNGDVQLVFIHRRSVASSDHEIYLLG